MAGDLRVDPGELRAAGASSEAVAAELATDVSGATGDHPSDAGIAAVDAEISVLQGRQSSRVTTQAGDLSTAGTRYGEADESGAQDISITL